jgi:hypothetical protein
MISSRKQETLFCSRSKSPCACNLYHIASWELDGAIIDALYPAIACNLDTAHRPPSSKKSKNRVRDSRLAPQLLSPHHCVILIRQGGLLDTKACCQLRLSKSWKRSPTLGRSGNCSQIIMSKILLLSVRIYASQIRDMRGTTSLNCVAI